MALAAIFLVGVGLTGRSALAQDDGDWTVTSRQVNHSRPVQTTPSQAAPTSPDSALAEQAPGGDGARMVCGELARPAAEPYQSIVADINREWGTDAPVYESVRVGSPHVSRGGCIFYNPVFIAAFLRGETDEYGVPDKTSMLYAIFAHELGHIVHQDYTRNVPSVTKELEADRFSGYTLERLGIARANITPFYSLGGDEFSGVHSHGFSNQRIAAFDQGWKRAEWNRPEEGGVAADSAPSGDASDATDDSSAATALP